MKNVKVILISAVLCAAIFANQRIAALGGDAGFWSGDRANVVDFPATINDHSFVEFVGIVDLLHEQRQRDVCIEKLP